MHSLLKFWLTFFPIFGMFFAEGASALATAGGGDAGTGDSGGNVSTGDSALSETGDGVSGDQGDVTETGESGVDSGENEPDPNALVDSGDGRKIPQKYQELFKNDKNLRAMYHSQQALMKQFPGGVREAVELARQVEEAGGLEGMEQVRSELDIYHKDSELFETNQQKWVETAFNENADASLKAFTHTLDYVGEHFPEQYDHLMAKVIVNDLGNLPVQDIYTILSGMKDNPQAQEAAKKLAAYYNSRVETSRKVPEKANDPKAKEFEQREQGLKQKEQQIRNKTINSEAAPYMNRSIDSALTSAAKVTGFNIAKLKQEQPNRYGRFIKDVKNAIHNEVLHDEKWLKRYSQVLESGDTAKAVRMLNARHDLAIKGSDSEQGIAAKVLYEWFGAPKGTRSQNATSRSAATTNATTKGVQFVNSLPPAKDIDYSWSGTDKWDGKYRLKSGQLIQVRR